LQALHCDSRTVIRIIDIVSDERDVVSDQCDALSDQCDALSDERDAVSERCDALSDERDAVSDERDIISHSVADVISAHFHPDHGIAICPANWDADLHVSDAVQGAHPRVEPYRKPFSHSCTDTTAAGRG
jgi:hypothetical protein